MDLASTIFEEEIAFIAGLDYGQDRERHLAALRQLIFQHGGVLRKDQNWYPYEVIELGANHIEPGYEREFAICTLLVVRAAAAGCDISTDLAEKLRQFSPAYAELPDELRVPILEAFASAGLS